jgi:hypothetical protein
LDCSCSPDTRERNTPSSQSTRRTTIKRSHFGFQWGATTSRKLHGGALDLLGLPALQEYALTIPSHYGRIWIGVRS